MFDANLRYGVRDKQAVFVKPYNLNSGLREIGLTTKEVYLAIKITKHSIRILIDGVWFYLEENEKLDRGGLIVYEGNPDFTGFIDENSLEMAKEIFGED
tara:strand:+ start:75125 stop:75421 length:297 start_codon:yes stop_codon:yes gene_type:complete